MKARSFFYIVSIKNGSVSFTCDNFLSPLHDIRVIVWQNVMPQTERFLLNIYNYGQNIKVRSLAAGLHRLDFG